MPPADAHSQTNPGLAQIWDDQAILQAAREKSLVLLESLLAQRLDLEMRGGAAVADNHLAFRSAMDRAIEAVRQTIDVTDVVQMTSDNPKR